MKKRKQIIFAAALTAFTCVVGSAAFYGIDGAPSMAAFAKTAASGQSVVFSAGDFNDKVSGGAKLDGIIITELPSPDDGTLVLAGRELLSLEGVSTEQLGSLEFIPASEAVSCAVFKIVPVFQNAAVSSDEIPVTVNIAQDAGSPPIAENLFFETYKGISICGRFKASDPDGGPISYQIIDRPKLGEAVFEDGGFRYAPYRGKSGRDFFTYVAVDDKGNSSDKAMVEIDVKNRSGKNEPTYSDMEGNPAHYAAVKLAEDGIIVGEKIGAGWFFRPNESVSRSEFAAMTVAASQITLPAAAVNTGLADDSLIAEWAKPYVSAALGAGIVKGSLQPDGSRVFRPNDAVTRAEAAVMINNAASLSADGREALFTDFDSIPVWAAEAASNLEAAKIISPDKDGALNPTAVITRAEAASMIYDMIVVVNSRR